MSALCLMASSRILSAPTITPRSTISYPLQPSTTPTIFFPISCTSPFTVASKILPAAEASCFAASMYGVRTATLFFMTRALFTTCGKNILPTPNRSPTMFIPSINGPSMTSNGRGYCCLASSVSASMYSVMPLISACFRRSSTGLLRQASSLSCTLPLALTVSANWISFSVAWLSSLFLLRITSSQRFLSTGSISS